MHAYAFLPCDDVDGLENETERDARPNQLRPSSLFVRTRPAAFPDQRGEPVQRTRPASNYGNRSVEPEVSVRNGALNTLELLREFCDLYPQPGNLRVGRLFAHRRDTHTIRGVTQPGGDAPGPGAESK